jgi:hypothetical protein
MYLAEHSGQIFAWTKTWRNPNGDLQDPTTAGRGGGRTCDYMFVDQHIISANLPCGERRDEPEMRQNA